MSKQEIQSAPVVEKLSYSILKKLIDIVCGSILIILFIPIYFLIAILIKLSSNGPVLYVWNVVGKNGVHFKSW